MIVAEGGTDMTRLFAHLLSYGVQAGRVGASSPLTRGCVLFMCEERVTGRFEESQNVR